MDNKEICGVQILSDFQVRSQTSLFPFPICTTPQKGILQIPPESHQCPTLEMLIKEHAVDEIVISSFLAHQGCRWYLKTE